jgi:hypothetical protein
METTQETLDWILSGDELQLSDKQILVRKIALYSFPYDIQAKDKLFISFFHQLERLNTTALTFLLNNQLQLFPNSVPEKDKSKTGKH